MAKKRFAIVLLLIVMMTGVLAPTTAQEKVQITWFIGLGTGTDPEQLEIQQQVVDEFNASQDRIELVLHIAADYETSRDALSTLIAAGDAPDIVGPQGMSGINAFDDSWLDLQPLVDATGYDLSQFPEGAVNFYRSDAGLIGLPLATYPSFLFYNRDLFDEADVPYPPTAYGEPYIDAEGNEHEWNVETMTELAKYLTVDAEGYDATMEEFDPENIVQWGFVHQWPDLRAEWTFFGSGSVYDPETGEAMMPEHWREEAKWYYNAIWTDHFAPNQAQLDSDLLGAGSAFDSGNVAMARGQLWYTCCLELTNWDAAPMPSYNGQIAASLDADTLHIMKSTEHPEEAFEVLTYLVGEASLDLLAAYGGMPARVEDREAFFAALDEKYPQGVNWQVVQDSIAYAENPSDEAWMPNYLKSFDRLVVFQSLVMNDPNVDVDAELDQLVEDLQVLFDEVATE